MNVTWFDQAEEERLHEPTRGSQHGHGHSHLPLTLAHVLLALWAWLANITQVANLLLDRKLRRQPRSVLIVSISVSELLVAGFLCPLYTDSLVRGPWRHGLLLCSLYEAVFYLQVCISSLAVLVLNVERFYFLLAPRLLQLAPAKHFVTALLTSLPWLVSVVVIAPLYTRGARATLEHVAGLHHRTCIVEWDRSLHIVTVFFVFLAPAFLLLTTAVAVLLLYVISAARASHEARGVGEAAGEPAPATGTALWPHREPEHVVMDVGSRRRRHFSGLQELDTRTKRECVLAVCVSSFLSVGLQFPFFALLLLQQFCHHPQPPPAEPAPVALLPDSGLHVLSGDSAEGGSCQFSDIAWATCMMLGMAKPGLLPLVWLFYSDIRAGLSLRACWCSTWRGSGTARARSRQREGVEGPESACPSLPSIASQMTVM